MRKILVALTLTVTMLFVTGCCSGHVAVSAIEGNLTIVLDRHDAYINSGKSPTGAELSDLQKRVQLRSTRLLRETMEAAKK